jgi:hypothetical protein
MLVARREAFMCDKCVELDRKIEHCRRLASSASDQKIIDQIEALVEQLLAVKASLHPENEQTS